MRKLTIRFAAAVALAAVPATSLQASCWSDAAVSAAQIRDMETMLMVSSLRCRGVGNTMIADYNRFVSQSRAALVQVNETLRAHFLPQGGLNAYDRYVTAVANRYGGGADGLSCDDMASFLSAANAERGSHEGLARLASVAGVDPILPGSRCTVRFAAK